MLERHEIETLLVLAEELHFGRTAQRLRSSTGQVSKTIKKLERRIGAALFERNSRAVDVTPIGRQLVENLVPHVAGIEDAVRAAMDAGRGVTGKLVAGYVGAQAEQLLLNAVRLFGSRHPECEVEIQRPIDHQAQLTSGALDVLIIAFPYAGMAQGPVLMSEARALAIPVGHPFEGRESVSLEDLAETRLIQLPADYDEEFRADRTPSHTPSGRPIPKGPVGYAFDEFLSLVSMGRGVYMVGEQTGRYYPRPDVTYVPVRDAPPVERGAVWLETNTTDRLRAFVQAATDANRSTVATAVVE